jgi:hypothetical protein
MQQGSSSKLSGFGKRLVSNAGFGFNFGAGTMTVRNQNGKWVALISQQL